MSLQEVLRNYEARKRQKERTGQLLRQEIERGIEEASIQALKLQNHVPLRSPSGSTTSTRTSRPSRAGSAGSRNC